MMSLITLDMETYYDQKTFSLSKMTTESYIRDKQFEVIGVGVKVDDAPATWFSGSHDEIKEHLNALDWDNANLVCHNTAFDGAILNWIFGIKPKYYFDTLSMARPLHGLTVGGSLAALAKNYGLPAKGNEVVAASGKRRKDFDMTELWNYGNYCKNDVDITYMLFNILKKEVPPKELYIIDMMLRMFIDPVLTLDKSLLEEHLSLVRQKKTDLMDTCFHLDDETLADAVADRVSGQSKEAMFKEMLMSNPKFAKLLESFGVTPPTKVSLRTGKEAYAFGKTDVEFKKLLEHENEQVQALVSARMGIKSTLEETRTESFIAISDRGTLPIMLNYYGAHTGRASGGDKINLQNLPRGGSLRKSIKAPDGHSMVASDSSQIEARVVAWLAGETDLLGAFAGGRDIYSEFASDVYGKKVTKSDKVERFVGKTCIAKGTLVLCDSGWKPIEQVSKEDKLWDGEEWVCHQGLVNNGIKETLNLCGVWLTPDHQVWSGTQWLEAQLMVEDESTLCQALDTAAENLPLQAISVEQEGVSLRLLLDADVVEGSTPSILTTSKTLKVQDALSVQKKLREKSDIGVTVLPCLTMDTEQDCSTDCLQPLQGVITKVIKPINTMVNEALKYVKSGGLIEHFFLTMSKPFLIGMSPNTNSTGSTSTAIMNRVISDSFQEAQTSLIKDEFMTSRKRLHVYDLACSGPRHRFTVLTEEGPLVVHNCILGLGYGMGKDKFKSALKIGMGGISVDVDIDEAERVVNLYRSKYANIAALWKEGQKALDAMFKGFEFELGTARLKCDHEGIHLPNGMKIIYPELRKSDDGNYEYKNRYGFTKIYGGKLIENVVQALARIVVFDQMAKIDQKLRAVDSDKHRFKVALTVHDEVVAVVPDKAAEKVKAMMEKLMTEAPSWCKDLPVACEADVGKSYADAK